MVRKRLVALFCVCLMFCGTAELTHAATPYQGTISTTYLTIFKDAVASLGINDDYVFYRSGEYSYTLLAGELDYNGKTFELIDGKDFTLTYQSGFGSDNYYHWSVSDGSGEEIEASDFLLYSSLGDYPRLEERGTVYAFNSFFILSVLGICALVRPLFSFVLRSRS